MSASASSSASVPSVVPTQLSPAQLSGASLFLVELTAPSAPASPAPAPSAPNTGATSPTQAPSTASTVPATSTTVAHADVPGLLGALAQAAPAHGVELIEAQVTSDRATVFVILEAAGADAAAAATAGLPASASEPAQVRLVGTDLDTVKASRPEAGYLVEWDIPDGINMDTYLTRKAEKSPLYAQVPEVSFLRTYVREDMAKCLCLYNAPDEDAVRHAREVVSTPVDRLHALERIEP